MWEASDFEGADTDQMWSVDVGGMDKPWEMEEDPFEGENALPNKLGAAGPRPAEENVSPAYDRALPGRLSVDAFLKPESAEPTYAVAKPSPGRISTDFLNQSSPPAEKPMTSPGRISTDFMNQSSPPALPPRASMATESGEQPKRRTSKVMELFAERERERLEQEERIRQEKDEKHRRDEEKRRIREQELREGRQEVKMTRRRREEALRAIQRQYDEELNKKHDNLSEQELLERQKRLLAAQMAIREQEAALQLQEQEEFKMPTEKDYEAAEVRNDAQVAARFIINPTWGIHSLQSTHLGKPRYLQQMRRLHHLCDAPASLDRRRDCVLVVFQDCSFLCAPEPGGELRLLFPPCDNSKIAAGPSLALDWKSMFSLRFDSLGPFYFECESESEVRYWNRVFAQS